MGAHRAGTFWVGFVIAALLALVAAGSAAAAQVQRGAPVFAAVHHDTSLPLRDMASAPASVFGHYVVPVRPLPRRAAGTTATAGVQRSFGRRAIPTTTLNILGVGNGFTGPQGAFSVQSAPPDDTLAVGPSDIVQIVNSGIAVYNKSGSVLYGPVATNTLFSGFGGGCQTNNDGDGSVSYDPIANRWVIQQFSVTTTPYLDCVAVSQTPDPTGAWYRYSFSYGNTDFPDYPKLAVWPDAYYITYNIFANGSTFSGPRTCAYDRAKMLLGQPATQQCFNASSSYGGILPSEFSGTALPPAGSPDYIVGLGASASNSLAYWKFHVDWATPANSTFTGPTEIPVASYGEACAGGTCIPQAGTSQQLDSLADRVMFRLSYRNFGGHESLVLNHSVTAGGGVGVRWYELRPDAGHNLSVFQQGTYAPDSGFRWMGSIAQDQAGDMGLGFSLSSSSLHPEVHYTGRLVGDAAGTMGQGEGTIINGPGSQTGSSLSRWGDYSGISVDPTDGCTFYYTNEYLPADGAFNWATRIGSFKFPSCGATTTNDFSISASPSTVTVTAGRSGTSTISTAVTSGSAQSIALSVSGVPSGARASLSPTSVTAGGSSTLKVSSGTAAAGTYSLTVTGTEGSTMHSVGIVLKVTNPGGGGIVNGGFETRTFKGWTTTGASETVVGSGCHGGTYCARLGSTSPTNGDSSTAQIFSVPAGKNILSFFYKVTCPDTVTYDWATATLKDNTANTTTTVLAKTCTAAGPWTQVTASVTAGHSYSLTLTSHDDNYAADPTYTLYDDVTLQ